MKGKLMLLSFGLLGGATQAFVPVTTPRQNVAHRWKRMTSDAVKSYVQPPRATEAGQTVYKPAGWDRELYRPPDEVLFEWQELLCCLQFMEDKDVNAAMLAPETRDMMVGYAEAVMAAGSPVRTLDELNDMMCGRWKVAFTTEDRYRTLPPGTKIYYEIYRNGTLKNMFKFNDQWIDGLESVAKYQISNQGRMWFEFTGNSLRVNNPLNRRNQWALPLPPNVGSLGSAFADVNYIDGTIWIEKLNNPELGVTYYTIHEYKGPCEARQGEGEETGEVLPAGVRSLEEDRVKQTAAPKHVNV